MVTKASAGRRLFQGVNYTFLGLLTLTCILPFVNLLAVSLSSNKAVASGAVFLWPVDFTTNAYVFLAGKREFLVALGVSCLRVLLGTVVSVAVVVLAAYPLSKGAGVLRGRGAYVTFFSFPLFFAGGMIPLFMTIRMLGMLDSIWALVLPVALNVWNVILMLNFFRSLPKELEESAMMDGASQGRILWSVYLPLSMPGVATVVLFTVVSHWNSWFDGLIYMNSPDNYPLQSYLYTMINAIKSITARRITAQDLTLLQSLSDKTLLTAQVFLAMVPILVVYPVLQRYFLSGMTIGAVKE